MKADTHNQHVYLKSMELSDSQVVLIRTNVFSLVSLIVKEKIYFEVHRIGFNQGTKKGMVSNGWIATNILKESVDSDRVMLPGAVWYLAAHADNCLVRVCRSDGGQRC